MAILAWVKSRRVFLKIQEGTGDNLSEEMLLMECPIMSFGMCSVPNA